MKKRPCTYIALLRGINVGGHNKIPMVELRTLCADIGWSDVQTYIQSGNLVFSAAAKTEALESELEKSIKRRFGYEIPVIVRKAEKWSIYVKGNPFAAESAKDPGRVLLAVSKAAPKTTAIEQLRERANNNERLVQTGDVIWTHFSEGVAGSKLSPALLDRLIGSPVTTRNWRTVLKLEDLAKMASDRPPA